MLWVTIQTKGRHPRILLVPRNRNCQKLYRDLICLDLSEHRLDDRLPPGIDFPPDDGLQYAPHAFQQGCRRRDWSSR
jgi:hypothetical protein